MPFTFSKNERLKSRKRIDQLFKEGKSLHIFPFRIVYNIEGASEKNKGLQAGVSVSKQHFKKAVDRNRIKRLMREAWRLQKNPLDQKLQSFNLYMSVFILFRSNEMPDFTMVSAKISKAIDQLIAILDEKNSNRP